MDAETVEQPVVTPEAAFDAAILVESNQPLPDADDITVEASADAAPVVERNDKGQFTRPSNAEARKDPKAKIGQAIYDREEAQRRADAAEKRAADAEARLAAQTKPAPVARPVEAAADPEPNPDDATKYPDGQFDRKFLKDQARWEVRQELQAHQRTAAQQAAQAARAEQVATIDRQFAERYTAAKAADPDFESKVDPRLLTTQRAGALADPSQATFGNFLIEQVFQSEHPKELLLHLSDPAEIQRLATLPPLSVMRELATVEARLGAAPVSASASKPLTSQAKPPIRPNGSSPTVSDPYEITDELTVDEHIRRGNAADRRAARGIE